MKTFIQFIAELDDVSNAPTETTPTPAPQPKKFGDPRDPGRVSELVRQASSGFMDNSTGKFLNMYNPDTVNRASNALKKIGMNPQGSKLQ